MLFPLSFFWDILKLFFPNPYYIYPANSSKSAYTTRSQSSRSASPDRESRVLTDAEAEAVNKRLAEKEK